MQYAEFEIEGQRLMIDACEYSVLLRRESLTEIGCPEEASVFYLCCGAYLPRRGKTEAEAADDLRAARDHWLGCLIGRECHLFALEDVQAFGAARRGFSLAIPVAALIRAREPAPWPAGKQTRALTCFLRYADLTPAENILNRPGVIALRIPARRLGRNRPEGWRKLVDSGRAARAARDIA
jgi:hypothetical protein